ncbi:MAG TPA: tetratricopeptide repeat protein [Candidatus Acidoferrales bacterium]|nr:tetratricopeptide repeat protein [Candidatus Acidoferrales bacterium]
MKLPEARTRLRKALPGICLFVCAVLSYGAARNWVAADRLYSHQLATIESGAALEPGNANAWDRLGRLRQEEFGDTDPRHAIADFEHALRDNPRCSYCLTDLAGAYEAAGNDRLAESEFERAEAAYPASAEVVWQHGNFLLRQQRFAQAFTKIRRAIRGNRSILPLAISRSWRATGDVKQILDNIVPRDADGCLAALDFFTSESQMDAGMAVWKRLTGLHEGFPIARTFAFLDELIREDRSDDARTVWEEALEATGSGSATSRGTAGSLIQDGRFTENLANGGLGWRWNEPAGAAASFDAAPDSKPGRSLRVDFSGGLNLDLSQPSQVVPVEPSQAYVFSAMIRTDEISTESGMRFSITDPNHPREPRATTDNMTGSHPWTRVRANVTTGADTHFLEVQLFRPPSRLFESKLGGTVWISDVSLAPATQAEAGIR